MEWSIRKRDIFLRVAAVPLFCVFGGALTLYLTIGAPSFWYSVCSALLVLLGFVWAWRPSVAAGLSVGPLLVVALLLKYYGGESLVVLATGLAFAVVLVYMGLRGSRQWRLTVATSFIIVGFAFATDRLFTNVHSLRTFSMGVAIDGKAPWGEVGPAEDGVMPVVLYRRVGESYCYEGLYSRELRERLSAKQGETVTVEYNFWTDFGRWGSYNIRSVDGVVLNDQHGIIKNVESVSGQIMSGGGVAPSCW